VARKRSTEQLEKELEELRAQNRALAEALTHDLATGMPNGLAFEADHAQLDAWRKRTSEPYAVLRVGVDGIRESPARFRGEEGEHALLALAHAVRDTVRQSDRAYVVDNGQFAVLFRGATNKQAIAAAERLRSRIAALAIPHPAHRSARLTVTIAAVEAGFRHAEPEDVAREAEELLDTAASQGGDRIIWPY
jgi:diguanylate cyclase (GGDEF)-like protein